MKQKSLLKRMWDCRILYLLALPAVISVFMFHYVPIYGIQIAFKDYSSYLGIWGSKWVGLKHFINFINHPMFWKLIKNTFAVTLTNVLFFPASLIFALMLNEMRNKKIMKACSLVTYSTHFVSVVVVCSLVTLMLDEDTGVINFFIQALGGSKFSFLSEPKAFVWIYNISGLWQSLGWGTIIYTATLSGVSPELTEAASIDGAGRFAIIWHVYLPHLKPTIVTLFVLKLGSILTVGFEKVFLLQNPLNKAAANVISTFVYEMGIVGNQLSFSAAVGLFQNIVNILLVLLANRLCKKILGVSIW